ncbi:MAG: ATP-binding cassette domain-containing protein [Acidimicrobiia bacterium]|nr:ATP-binding cassette domain-containing protein [Acidimicrobiia bacterium]
MVDDTPVATIIRPQIHIQNAVKSFSGRVVVDVDELTLGDHAIEGLIGPNGAGKTTLMRMIMHSTPLDRGTITMSNANGGGDVVISDLPTHWMAPHGLVKSNQVIMDFDKLTILDSMLLAIAQAKYEQPHRLFVETQVYDAAVERVHEYMEYFELGDPYRFAGSAGEKKLLDIIRCLLLEPRFLLLDEPTAGLPDDVTEKVMAIIRDLAVAGTSVVIVEHDLNVIWNLSDDVHFMAEGSVVMHGSPAEIRENKTVIEKYLGEGHV